MQVMLTPEDLIAFEDDVAALFQDRKIRAPIHLSGGNEQQLIEIFKERVGPEDWVCTTWRSHYHCLLKGVPPVELRQAILDGRSIDLCFPQHRVVSSAIVGGTAPLAVGLAMGIDFKSGQRKVVCFLGDMAAESGTVFESIKYAINWRLPVLWVIEDNGKSGDVSTLEAWGGPTIMQDPSIIRYAYAMTRPHVGCGEWVTF